MATHSASTLPGSGTPTLLPADVTLDRADAAASTAHASLVAQPSVSSATTSLSTEVLRAHSVRARDVLPQLRGFAHVVQFPHASTHRAASRVDARTPESSPAAAAADTTNSSTSAVAATRSGSLSTFNATEPAHASAAADAAAVHGTMAAPELPSDEEAPLSPMQRAVLEAASVGELGLLSQSLTTLPSGSVRTLRGAHGASALHLFVASGAAVDMPAVTAAGVSLLLAAGADLNARCANGSTPLHWAAGCGNLAAVKALVAAGADTLIPSYTWRYVR
ncbi:ankyrin repeat domain-containing protein [archaeon]|nr:MAG: ankyrin repeat domain-containing protein [archaeon]